MGEHHLADALDAGEQPHRFGKAGGLAGRQVDLARVAGDDHAAVLAEPGEKHLHLHRGRVLRLVENDHCVGQRATAHEGERRDLDLVRLQGALDDAGVHEIGQRIVDRAQIGIDLLAQVAGQETEPLAGLDRGSRQDDAIDLLALEQGDGVGDREPGLAGAGRADAEHHRMAAQCADVSVLHGGAGAHRAFAQVDLLEARARRGGVEVEQRALCDREPDRALDVTGDEIAAALELLVEAFEHATRLLAGIAAAFQRDVIAALLGDDAEAALDQGEVLAVLTEQRRGEPVVVERDHDLGRRFCGRSRDDRSGIGCASCQLDQAPIAAGAGSRTGAEAKVPNRLFDPTPVIPTAAISPINDDGAMTWTGCKYGDRPTI